MAEIESGTSRQRDIELQIRALADRHHVVYTQTATDILGHHITRLSGDDVLLDQTELLLLALERAGHVSGLDAVQLHAAYLNRARL